MKKIVIQFALICSFSFAQDGGALESPFSRFQSLPLDQSIGKYGLDTIKCEENLTIYNEFYKQKSYDSAIDAWFYLFVHAQKRTKNIYIHGSTMYKHFIKNEKDSVYITIAGRSSALSGFVAANSEFPTLGCPPFSDKADMLVNVHSTLQMPSNTPVLTVLDPGNCALAVKRILGV